MTLTQKETDLLKDLKTQEELCIEKYGRNAVSAKSGCLKNLFSSIATTERNHLSTIEKMLKGEEIQASAAPATPADEVVCSDDLSKEDKAYDAFLCQDALSMEKHTSSLYDVCIFEFNDPTHRDALSHIQKEEQNHGKQLYDYLSQNGLANLSF